MVLCGQQSELCVNLTLGMLPTEQWEVTQIEMFLPDVSRQV